MSAPDDWKLTTTEHDRLNILHHQDKVQREIAAKAADVLSSTEPSVRASEALLGKYGIDNPLVRQDHQSNRRHLPPLRTWQELVAEAEANADTPALLHHVFTPEEMEATWQNVAGLR